MPCTQCEDTHWVSENHADRPWEFPHACGCGGAGAPCLICNAAGTDELPLLPKGFETSFASTETIRPLLRGKRGKQKRSEP